MGRVRQEVVAGALPTDGASADAGAQRGVVEGRTLALALALTQSGGASFAGFGDTAVGCTAPVLYSR